MLQDQLALPIVGRPPTGKSRKEIVRESQARRRARYGGVSISLQVDKELHRSLKKAAEKNNITLSDYITELFLKDVEFKSSIVKNTKKVASLVQIIPKSILVVYKPQCNKLLRFCWDDRKLIKKLN